jgi:hypothetical protein
LGKNVEQNGEIEAVGLKNNGKLSYVQIHIVEKEEAGQPEQLRGLFFPTA